MTLSGEFMNFQGGGQFLRAFQAFFMIKEVGWLALKMHENMSFLAKILVLWRKFLSLNIVLAFQKLGGGQAPGHEPVAIGRPTEGT